MSSILKAKSNTADLDRSLSDEGRDAYGRLLRIVHASHGSFAVLPIESDFSPALRSELLRRLGVDLSRSGIRLRVVELTHDNWDSICAIDSLPENGRKSVIALVGLEETPEMFLEAGAKPRRPPALAAMNVARETLRRRVATPIIVWCDPLVYTRLMEHAPDFFDHYTALFTFLDAVPKPTEIGLAAPHQPRIDTLNHHNRPTSALVFYREMLNRYPDPSADRANALLGLADAEIQFKDDEYNQRLQRAWSFAVEALQIAADISDKYLSARSLITSGAVLIERQDGDQKANLEDAIKQYTEAIHLLSAKRYAEASAVANNNLGRAYSARISGSRESNLRSAIACYEAALSVWNEARNSRMWAASMRDLGAAYHALPNGNRGDNYLKALSCYQSTLRVITAENAALDWAMTQVNIGNVYADLPTGDHSENLRTAIACFASAASVAKEHGYLFETATAQYNLGMAYSALAVGDSSTNLSHAIENLTAALCVRTRASYPYEWAMTQIGLGTAYYRLAAISGNLTHFSQAKCHYRLALEVYTHDMYPSQWAGVNNNLGALCQSTGDNDGGIAHYKSALTVWTEEASPAEWSMANNNLAVALLRRGDAASIRAAQDCLRLAASGFNKVGLDQQARSASERLASIDNVRLAA